MNDIQAKENIYNAMTAAVEKHQANVVNTNNQLLQAQNAYMNSMIHAATLIEKARRKKDILVNLIKWGICGVLALLLLLINVLIGVLFIVAVIVIATVTGHKTSIKKAVNYNNRKSFFMKYSHVIPDNEQLKWKNLPDAEETQVNSDGWICPDCATDNKNDSDSCIYCGREKP